MPTGHFDGRTGKSTSRRRGRRSANAEPLRRSIEPLAVRRLGELLHLDLQIVHEGLDLRVPGTEIRGGDLEGCDAVGAVGGELAAAQSFQIGDPLADVGGEVGAGGLEGVEALVDGGGAVGAGAVEVSEPALPLLVVVVEAAVVVVAGFLDLVEDDLELWIHGSQRAAEAGEVLVVDLVGFQLDTGERIGSGWSGEGGEQDRRRQIRYQL